MSWYQQGLGREMTPQKDKLAPYVQVPSSSPVGANSHMDLPSNPLKNTDEAVQRSLESRRQALRNHKDFPMVRKKFHYLPESVIFKGFVKGRGNLREITKWLSENYSRDDYLKEQRLQEAKRQEAEEKERAERNMQQLLKEYEKKEQAEAEAEAERHEEDESPIKIRGQARRKTIESPVKSQETQSTKVQLSRPKMSILDKYKTKKQLTLADMLEAKKRQSQPPVEDQPAKKKKLVRLSNLDGFRLTPATSISASASPEPIKKIQSFSFQGEPHQYSFNRSPTEPRLQKSKSPESMDDELDILEEKIRKNKINKKSVRSQPIDVFSDDDASDDMSNEEEYVSGGLTSMDSKILEFLNNASELDLGELGGVPPPVVELVISMRPFTDINDLAEDHLEIEKESDEKKEPPKRKVRRKPLGLKLIESVESNLKGYRAVDSLVKQCSEFTKLISDQMKHWGVSVTGNDGELEVVDLEKPPEAIEVEAVDDDDDEDDDIKVVKKKALEYISEAPSNFNKEFQLKSYQLFGINWINLLYTNKLSCILADEMGLGKTCQVIAFMAYLKTIKQKRRPHLVVVPSSTLENWLREFAKFCPEIVVQAYYGDQYQREELRYELRDSDYDVMVTTYTLASTLSNDFKFLKRQQFDVVVYDEGHMLKNSNSDRYNKLMRLDAKFRLLLTGTPLQNNLKELISLLAFMLPHLFVEKKDDLQSIFKQKAKAVGNEENYNPLLSIQAISKARTMMTPFVLRRRKNQVLKNLPQKISRVVYCELTPAQKDIYDHYMNQGKANRLERERRKMLSYKDAAEARKTIIPGSTNLLMSLRKATLHPLLFRRKFTDEIVREMAAALMKEPAYPKGNKSRELEHQYLIEDLEILSDYELDRITHDYYKAVGKYKLKDEEYLNCGKVEKAAEIIKEVIAKKEKVLIFSLFTQVLDILERVMSILNIKFIRLDGLTGVEIRQDLIDTFYDDETIPVFLLSTRAGGFGINLVAANNVIVFDQSFNPHDDKQAEDRAHRVGQTKDVIVTKLITTNTIEENILQLAENKLQLDQSISEDTNGNIIELKASSLFDKLLFGS